MPFVSDDLPKMPLPPVERPARFPFWGAGALAAGQAAWLLTRAAPRWHEHAAAAGSPGRWAPVALAPEGVALLAAAAVLAVFGLARRLGGAWTGLVAALVFVFAHAATVWAGETPAQTVAMALLAAGAWWALRFVDDPSVFNGLATGLCVGAVPAFSRTGTIGGAAVALWVVWQLRPRRRSWPLALGVAAPLGWLGGAHGAAVATAWAAFFRNTGRSAGRLLARGGETLHRGWPDARGDFWLVLTVLGLAGLAALVLNRRRRAEGGLLAGVALAMAACLLLGQSPAWPGHAGFLPLPFLVVAGVGLLMRTAERGATGARVAVAGIAIVQLALGMAVWSANASRARDAAMAAANARAFAEKNIATGGVIIGPSSLVAGLPSDGKWRLLASRQLGGFRPDGAAPLRSTPAAGPHGSGKRERRELIWRDLRAQAQAGPVYWFTRSTESLDRTLHGRAGYEVVGEFTAPRLAPVGGHGGSGGERHTLPAGADRTARAPQLAHGPHGDAPQTLTVVRLVFATE